MKYLSLSLLCISAPLLAQEPITITLKKQKNRLSATAFTHKDRENYKAFDLKDAFEFESGLFMAQGGGLGTPTQIKIRGGEQRHTKAFFEGIPLADASNYDSSAVLDHPMIGTSKITLHKGLSADTLGAFGGSLRFQNTRPRLGFHGESTTAAASFNTFHETAELSYGAKHYALRAHGNSVTSAGQDLYKNRKGKFYHRDYQNHSGGGTLYLNPNERSQIKAFAESIHGFNRLDEQLYPGYKKNTYHLGLQGFEAAYLIGKNDHEMRFLFGHTKSTRGYHNKVLHDIFEGETYFVNPSMLFYLSDDQKTSIKTSFELKDDTDLQKKHTRNLNKGYVRFEAPIKAFDVKTSFHITNLRQTPLTFNTEVGYSLPQTKVRAFSRLGTDVETPSLWMLHDKNFGNKALKPEKSKALEVGFETDYETIAPEALVFARDINHFLDYNPQSSRYENAHKAFVRGFEGRVSLKASETLSFTFNYTHTFIKKTPQKIQNFIPKNSVNGALRYAFAPHFMYISETNVADRRQISENTLIKTPILWNHTLSYKPKPFIILKAGVSNSLHARYEESYKILAPMRSFFGSATLRF